MHLVGRIGKAFELQIKFSVSLAVRLLFAKIDRLIALPLFFFVKERIVKAIVRKFGKTETAWRETEAAGNPPVGCGRSIEIRQRDFGLEIFWFNPTTRDRLGKNGLNLHPVGQKLLYLDVGRAEQRRAFVILNQVNIYGITTGGRFVRSLITELGEPTLRQCEFSCLYFEAARIQDFCFERQPVDVLLPVSLFDHDTDVDFVARAINPAFGKNERVQIFGQNVFVAADVEAREV